MIYANYSYYVSIYLGGHEPSVKEDDWTYYARQAGTYMESRTFGRIDTGNIPESVRLCACELTEILCRSESGLQNGTSGPVTAYSNDGQSASFAVDANNVYTQEGKQKAMNAIINRYLANTGMLYSGGGCYAVKSEL